MKRVRPSQAMLAYLDTELIAPVQPVRRLPRAAIVAVAAVVLICSLVFAAVAFAQEPRAAVQMDDASASVYVAHGSGDVYYYTLIGVMVVMCAVATLLVRRHRYPLYISSWRPPARAILVAGESRAAGRLTNEDACRVLHIGGHDVLQVADGLGGLPGGARASALAMRVATRVLRRRLSTPIPPRRDRIEAAIREVFCEVEMALAREARETGLDRVADAALCTTLLVVVGTTTSWVAAGIGDGSILVRRASGETLHLFTPQKQEGDPTILDACLGPVRVGEPVFSVRERCLGDVALVMTDGVADRVALDDLAARVDARLHASNDADLVVREVLDDVDAQPTTFDDNATVAIAWGGP